MNNIILSPITISEMRLLIREEIVASITKNQENCLPHETKSEYLTIEETAKYINMAVSSVYSFVHFKRIPYIKRGKRLIFEKLKIDEWLQAGRKQTIDEMNSEVNANIQSHFKTKK